MSGIIKTRIIVSRWPDECDVEHRLQTRRKRSDGRLKRHISCDDLRAWVNNNCVKNEHLLDFMSNGESTGGQSYRLYGRFIPVPILVELLKNNNGTNEISTGTKTTRQQLQSQNSLKSGVEKSGIDKRGREINSEKNGFNETASMQKSLFECTGLLEKALSKLEKIDCIVTLANEETENSRNEEIKNAFYKAKLISSCTRKSQNHLSGNVSSSKSYVSKLRDSANCTELMRKISGLREKLKKVQECQQEVKDHIKTSQRRAERCSSSLQVTEIYNCPAQARVKRLHKKLERLIAEKGRLLSQMCQALHSLKTLKKSSRSSMSFRKKNSRASENDEGLQCECVRGASNYTCECSSNFGSEKSSDLSSCESCTKRDFEECGRLAESSDSGSPTHSWSPPDRDLNCDSSRNSFSRPGTQATMNNPESQDSVSGKSYNDECYQTGADSSRFRKSSPGSQQKSQQISSRYDKAALGKNQKGVRTRPRKKKEPNNSTEKKTKLKFICPEPTCKKSYKDSLSDFQNSLSPEQQAIIQKALDNVQKFKTRNHFDEGEKITERRSSKNNSPVCGAEGNAFRQRPNTSPTTRAERWEKSLDRNPVGSKAASRRRTKSETTMKDIEKTLRNYEVRLDSIECLDYKVEELKLKLAEANRLRQQIAKQKAEENKQRAADREKSSRELGRLCSENWELKKQVQQLTASFETQCRKMQSLICSAKKARELECEAEELKMELSKYRDGFEHQRKCITKWESVIALQRTEIENLMNHIRKLTTARENAYGPCPERKNMQRSRSYSPEAVRGRGATGRSKRQAIPCRMSSDEEEPPCCCDEFCQQHSRRMSSERNYCPPPAPNRRAEWCMN